MLVRGKGCRVGIGGRGAGRLGWLARFPTHLPDTSLAAGYVLAYVYMHVYVCMYMCVCMYMREQRGGGTPTQCMG